jgi:hypothetical protein
MVGKTKKEERVIRRPFFLAGICLIVMFFLINGVFFMGLTNIPSFRFIFSILLFFGYTLIFIGFFYLGKRHNSKFFTNLIIIGFVLFLLSIIFGTYYSSLNQDKFLEMNDALFARESYLNQLKIENASLEVISTYEKETAEYILGQVLPLFVPFLIVYLLSAIYSTLFGVGMIMLKKVKYSKTIGILTIISVWLIPTIIGILLAIPMFFVSFILIVLMFFDESKKAKE